MKKLLLILIALPLIGFGQDIYKKKGIFFQIGINRLVPANSQHNIVGRLTNVKTKIGVSSKISYQIEIKKKINYTPSLSFNMISLTRYVENTGISEYNANLSLLSINNEIGYNFSNKFSVSSGISFDILLKDKGTYIVEWSNLLGNDNIDPQYGFIYPSDENMPNGASEIEYSRKGLGYYSSFSINFKYVIYKKTQTNYFVFTDFKLPFYYSQQPQQSELKNANSISPDKQLNLQFSKFVSLGVGIDF